ncbi:MAG TPA: AMP-binding protein [Tepidisphaeraceae bacterium]|nr:AMP-binding protein [Tepidisphaeraceae bacterium]
MLIEPFLSNAASQPDEIAVVDETGRHTYRQLAGFAAALAQRLSETTSRSHIGLLLPSGAGFVGSFYGSLIAGKSVTPINFLLGQREIEHVLSDSGIDTVVTVPFFAPKLAGSGLKMIDLSQFKPSAPVTMPGLPQRSPDDMAVLMYTSGTSGLPKGVVLSYGNLQSDVDVAIEYADFQHRHTFLGLIPLFHSFGMTGTLLAPMQLGSTAVYMTRFNATAAVKAIAEHRISMVLAVPSMFAAMLHLKNASAEDFANIQYLFSGGEPLPPAVGEAFQNRFGQRIYEGYGLTETSPVVALNIARARRQGSVGKALPSVRIKIVNDDGGEQPAGESGEVWLAGPMIMKGYHHLPEETAAVLTSDGFFKTGDIGKLDSDGYLYIVGRKKELIIVAGEKAAPREIEDALMGHPAVAEAAVVGKKDTSRGEVVVAFVILKEGQTVTDDQLRQTCRDALLPQWKIPREIYFQTELPRTPTGKVLKRVLAQRVNEPAGQ